MSGSDRELLEQFVSEQSQDAFTALVNRHVNLVYSAALRQVRSPELAQEVCQTVFTHLANAVGKLRADTILTAWLYQVARCTAINVIRREARRQAREKIAVEMSNMNESSTAWKDIEPLLDAAMESLEDTDRAAILLRYFENKSLREVGEALGASEDAAQKRVSRAVERLREFFSRRKLAVGTSALAALLSANAVQAAPAGVASALATGTVLATGAAAGSSAISSSIPITLTKTIAMTALQKTVIAVAGAGALVAVIYQGREVSKLRGQVQSLEQQQQSQAALSNEVQELQRQRDDAASKLAALAKPTEPPKKGTNELLKLRGEVGRLRKENADINSSSGLSKVTANPESRKMLRQQQKMGMTMIYKDFATRANLTSEQTEQLNDLLADHIMDNVEHVTAILRDKATPEQMNEIFAGQEAVLEGKVQSLLGQDGLAQYQDYTKNLLSSLTSEQFKGMLTGPDDSRNEKAKQLYGIMVEEAQAALARAGLPADYQTIPMLNFGNIASEQQGEQSLKLLEDIYQRVAARSGSFLSPEELEKFQLFRNAAISNNRSSLRLNRTLMAPIGTN